MPQAFVRGALSLDGAIRLISTQSGNREMLHERTVPKHRLCLLPTEQPIEHAPVSGRGNVGDGHRSFSSGASILRY